MKVQTDVRCMSSFRPPNILFMISCVVAALQSATAQHRIGMNVSLSLSVQQERFTPNDVQQNSSIRLNSCNSSYYECCTDASKYDSLRNLLSGYLERSIVSIVQENKVDKLFMIIGEAKRDRTERLQCIGYPIRADNNKLLGILVSDEKVTKNEVLLPIFSDDFIQVKEYLLNPLCPDRKMDESILEHLSGKNIFIPLCESADGIKYTIRGAVRKKLKIY